jgi:hypothetical protein
MTTEVMVQERPFGISHLTFICQHLLLTTGIKLQNSVRICVGLSAIHGKHIVTRGLKAATCPSAGRGFVEPCSRDNTKYTVTLGFDGTTEDISMVNDF